MKSELKKVQMGVVIHLIRATAQDETDLNQEEESTRTTSRMEDIQISNYDLKIADQRQINRD